MTFSIKLLLLLNLIMRFPLILVNFKTYENATSERAFLLAKIHEKVVMETGASVAIAVQTADLYRIAPEVKIPVFAQHVDAVSYGANTGFVLPESVRDTGAYGTLLNHAEHKLSNEVLEKSIKAAKKSGLFTCVCADTPENGAFIMKFDPDLVAIEPPELIGGDVSVSTASPEVIKKAVKLIGKNRVLVGAGIKTSNDIKIALELGACGVLLASGITKAKDPEKVLRDLVSCII